MSQLVISLLFLDSLASSASAICYGHFTTDSDGVCKWECYDDGSFLDKSTLTFDFIRDKCSNVMGGFRYNRAECSDLDDLVYSSSSCSCPYCQCTTKDTAGSPKSWQQLFSKTCENCTCAAHPYDPTVTSLVYQCEQVSYVSDPYNWDDFECPNTWDDYTECRDTISGDTYGPGGAYFQADEKCDKFCYCKDSNGNADCYTGFENILDDSTSDEIKLAFWDECEWQLKACVNEPDRMFAENGCSWGGCPMCDCGDHTLGDIWYVEYQSNSHPNATSCARCECTTSWRGNLYADCDSRDWYPNSASGYSCPGTASISCHEQSEYEDCSSTAGTCVEKPATVDPLNSMDYKSNQPEEWCSNMFNIDGQDGDDYGYLGWDWRNDFSLFCGVYGENKKCYWYDYSIDYVDCYGGTTTDSQTFYGYCCNTDNCNHMNITMTKATCYENTDMKSLSQKYFECIYDNEDCDAAEQQNLTCTAIKDFYVDHANCECLFFKHLYDDADAAWKEWIKEQIDIYMFMNSLKFSEWNDVLDCPGRLVCDLSGETHEIIFIARACNKCYVVSALVIALIVILN